MKNYAVTIWGKSISDDNWAEWYEDTKALADDLGFSLSLFCVTGMTNGPKNVVTVARKEKDLLSAISEGDVPTGVCCYDLPDNFKVAMFDYKLCCSRTTDSISIVLRSNDMDENVVAKIVEYEKKYISLEYGEVFSTDLSELPMLYVLNRTRDGLDTYAFCRQIKN